MIISVHQPQYLPWLGYFDKIARSDAFVVLDCVQYKHREFENRNKIRIDKGWQWLTVPVKTEGKRLQQICGVEIDESSDWRRRHWHALTAWYGSCPYFKNHAAFFEAFYAQPKKSFCDAVMPIIRYLLEQLQIATPLYFESQLKTTHTSSARIIELCQALKADTYLSGEGGKAYLDEAAFAQAGIKVAYQHYAHPVYRQRFASSAEGFIANLSAVDLLFNEGPASAGIVRAKEATQ